MDTLFEQYVEIHCHITGAEPADIILQITGDSEALLQAVRYCLIFADSFWKAVKLFNQYCDEMDKMQVPPSRWTASISPELHRVLRYLEQYHSHQINSIQIELFN